MANLSKTAAIVGVAESDELGVVPGASALGLHLQAAANALADAGIERSEVDGLLTAGYWNYDVAEYLGISPRYTDSTSVGGSSFVIHVAHAIAAINAGYCEVALVTHGQAGRSSRTPPQRDPALPTVQYEYPYGFIGQPVNYALAASRYMHQYGEDRTRQALAEIAVSTRRWATLNPKALMRDEMTFDDYHNSRWIARPFHLLDCCLVTDAGAAVVVTSAERARSMRKKPVWVLGAAEHHDHAAISQMPDLTITPAAVTGPRALQMAGLGLKDMGLAMIYDSFTYTVLATLESLGYCGPGEGPDFVANQRTAPGGEFPLNTSGGGLSDTHPGMYGIFLIVEAVRQLRGEAGERQVANLRHALVNGTGGSLSSTGTIILGVE
jgi:acetyl-CoA acetyltransferase